MPTEPKLVLRQQFRALRKQVPVFYRREAAQAAAALLVNHTLFKHARHMACYLPFQDEFDTQPIIDAIWQAKKHCYLPVLAKNEEKSLVFMRYQYGDPLHPNRYSILEPVKLRSEIAAEQLEIVITPLLAFDLLGHRLGTGAGYYDRTFAGLNSPLFGLAYASQQADRIPHDPWDVLLSGVITEHNISIFTPSTP